MRVVRPGRLGAAVVISLLVSAIVGAITTGSVASRSNPVLAQAVSPFSCEAVDLLAFATFQASVSQPTDLTTPSRRAAPLAKAALRCAPLMPRSRAILAMAVAERPARAKILLKAEQMNRREILLQGLVLQEHLANRDVGATTATLDRILRVHPAREADFFPILVNALADFDAVDELAEVLDGSAPWHQRFLDDAVTQPRALPVLAVLYPEIDSVSETFEPTLIRNLARSGLLQSSWETYGRVIDRRADRPADAKIGSWVTELAPFDWTLASTKGLRAQPSFDGARLDISVEPGNGGVLAHRIMLAPKGQARVKIAHQLMPSNRLDGVRIIVECVEDGRVLLDQSLATKRTTWTLDSRAEGCDFVKLKLIARVYATDQNIHGSVGYLTLNSI